METKAAGINPLLIQRSRDGRVENACDALRALSEEGYAFLDEKKGALSSPEHETYKYVMDAVESVLKLAGQPHRYNYRSLTWGNVSAADSSMRLESRLAEASDDTLKAITSHLHSLERTLNERQSRRAVVLNAIPEKVRDSRVVGRDALEFLGWDENVAQEADGIFGALWCRLYDESKRRAERAESAA